MQYRVGEFVIYGNNGVCQIKDIGCPEELQEGNKRYYTLRPVYTTEVIYAPIETKVFMRPIVTRQEALELIAQIPYIAEDTSDTRDRKQVMDRYQGFIRSHDCKDLVQLIKTAYLKNKAAMDRKRVPGQVDQYFMKRAEELLYGELAVALGMERDAVEPFIVESVAAAGA